MIQKKKTTLIDFGFDIARVTHAQFEKTSSFNPRKEAQLEIVTPSFADEHSFSPAQSISIYGNTNLQNLCDALIEALKEK